MALEYQLTLKNFSIEEPDTVIFTLDVEGDVATNTSIFATWLHDNLKNRAVKLKINRTEVDVDEEEIKKIENDLIDRYSPDWNIVTRSKIRFNSMRNKFGGNEMIDINRPNTNKQKILNFLSANKDNGYCDECLENELDIHPRQQINQICRILKNEGKVDRIKSKCQNCKKEKILVIYIGNQVNTIY